MWPRAALATRRPVLRTPLSPAGTTCRASAGVCDVAESCTGREQRVPGGQLPVRGDGMPRGGGRRLRRGRAARVQRQPVLRMWLSRRARPAARRRVCATWLRAARERATPARQTRSSLRRRSAARRWPAAATWPRTARERRRPVRRMPSSLAERSVERRVGFATRPRPVRARATRVPGGRQAVERHGVPCGGGRRLRRGRELRRRDEQRARPTRWWRLARCAELRRAPVTRRRPARAPTPVLPTRSLPTGRCAALRRACAMCRRPARAPRRPVQRTASSLRRRYAERRWPAAAMWPRAARVQRRPVLRMWLSRRARPAARRPGVCDVAESCTGASNACPANSFVSAATVCRAAVASGCDVAETCTGSRGGLSCGRGCRGGHGVSRVGRRVRRIRELHWSEQRVSGGRQGRKRHGVPKRR